MKPDLTKSSPAERAETIDALCSKLRWLAEILTGRRQFNSRVPDTELTGVVEAMQQAADLLVSLHGQQASLSRLECDPSLRQRGWDGYDAAPLSTDAVEQARAFLAGASAVPTVAGGVQLEWHTPDADIEIEFEPGAAPFYYLHDRSTDARLAIPDDEAGQQASLSRPSEGSERTERLYRCDHCQHENMVTAERHSPRVCPLTNCNGTQSPVGQQASLEGELQEFGNRLAASQRPLPPDAAKLLNEHAFELYGGQQASREQERESKHALAVRALDAAALWEPAKMAALADTIERAGAICEGQYLRTIASRVAGREAAEQQIKTLAQERDAALKALDARDEDNPAAQALDDLWRDIILARNPAYGDWEYPGQAYRHLLAEHRDVAQERDALREEIAELLRNSRFS
jgi:hypothetical protein